MVLLQDIEFIDRQIANVSRNIANLESALAAGSARGQIPGGPNPCIQSFRAGSQDCAAWRLVQGIPAQLEPLKKELDDLLFKRQQQTELLEIQSELDIGPVVEPPIIEQTLKVQNITLRNALIVGVILLLI